MVPATVVESLCPIFHFSPDEILLPCRYEVAAAALRSAALRSGTGTGSGGSAGKVPAGTPLYYAWNQIDRHVTYIVMYAADGGLHGVGSHPCDVEFVRLYYSETESGMPDDVVIKLTKAYYAAHGRDQGTWIDGPSVPRDPATGRPVVFVARSTHAMYPAAGCWPRVFCLGNDHARASRAMWDPVDALMPIGNPDAVRTDLGDGHMQWHAQTDELVGAPRGRRAAALYRLFYPLSAHKA